MESDSQALSTILAREPFPIFRKASLRLVSRYYTLRCDPKQAEGRFHEFDRLLGSVDSFSLGDVFPLPFIKGEQPTYLQSLDPSGVPVINTLAIQNLSINTEACRYIAQDDFDSLPEDRKLQQADILLTLDGGTSIGKPVLFNLEGDFTVDSHIALIRQPALKPLTIVYLLASPFGQIQFQRAESGASGQTAVTEEDIRRFRFPKVSAQRLDLLVESLNAALTTVNAQLLAAHEAEANAWRDFNKAMMGSRSPAGQC